MDSLRNIFIFLGFAIVVCLFSPGCKTPNVISTNSNFSVLNMEIDNGAIFLRKKDREVWRPNDTRDAF